MSWDLSRLLAHVRMAGSRVRLDGKGEWHDINHEAAVSQLGSPFCFVARPEIFRRNAKGCGGVGVLGCEACSFSQSDFYVAS